MKIKNLIYPLIGAVLLSYGCNKIGEKKEPIRTPVCTSTLSDSAIENHLEKLLSMKEQTHIRNLPNLYFGRDSTGNYICIKSPIDSLVGKSILGVYNNENIGKLLKDYNKD